MVPSVEQFIARMAPDDRAVGWVLVPTIYASALSSVVAFAITMVLSPDLNIALGFVPSNAALLLALLLAWRGQVRVSSWVVISSLAVIVNAACLLSGGVHASAFIATAAILVLAAMLLNPIPMALYVIVQCGWVSWMILNQPEIDGMRILDTSGGVMIGSYVATTIFIIGMVRSVVGRYRMTLLEGETNQAELRHTLEELEHTSINREHLGNIVSAVSDMMLVTDTAGSITQCNPASCEQLGIRESDLLERPLADLFKTSELAVPVGRSRNLVVFRSDGRELPVLVSRGGLPDGGDVWVLTDVTVQEAAVQAVRRAHARADSANQAKSQFLANMSHELRTPLNAIIGYAELIDEDAPGGRHAADLQRIKGSGEHLLRLINGILDLSKVEAGKMQLELEHVDLKPLLSQVCDTVRPHIEGKGLDFPVSHTDLPPQVRLDAQKMRQILLNLLSNAAKFTDTGEVALSVVHWTRDGMPWLRFVVSDTGIGMDAEQLNHVFEPFAQGTDGKGGTGLGLSISRAFVQMMGGEIHVDSRIDKGSVFTVELPVGELEHVRTPDPGRDRALPATRPDAEVILHIDDDTTTLGVVARLLQRSGRRVLGTTSPLEGLTWARMHRPDLVLLDVVMPELSGWAVLAALRETHTPEEMNVLMLTTEGEESVAEALGANGLLNKPIDRETLQALVEAQLDA